MWRVLLCSQRAPVLSCAYKDYGARKPIKLWLRMVVAKKVLYENSNPYVQKNSTDCLCTLQSQHHRQEEEDPSHILKGCCKWFGSRAYQSWGQVQKQNKEHGKLITTLAICDNGTGIYGSRTTSCTGRFGIRC